MTSVQQAGEQITEGKAKILRQGDDPQEIRVTFKDCATAFNGKKFAEIPGKGSLNARISAKLFGLLEAQGLPTCFIRPSDKPNELVYRRLSMIPLEVVVRNIALGSICKRFQLSEGRPFKKPLIEFFLKDDAANDPQITDEMIAELGVLPDGIALQRIKELAFEINEVFVAYFESAGIRCADFKLEFGVDSDGRLAVGDELSPDNFRLRDSQTGEVLDKDVFRLELGDLVQTYEKLLGRLEGASVDALSRGNLSTYRAEVLVQSRKNILNPESKAIFDSLEVMGYREVKSLSAGRRFELLIDAPNMLTAEKRIQALTESLLANPVIEDFSWSLFLEGNNQA
jgi:phosphoribosylaminoimidazole-succinocarboxamide synthase